MLSEWQSIESAPLGRPVLIWIPFNASMLLAFRFSEDDPWTVNANADSETVLPRTWAPTHWMQLPKPPLLKPKDIKK